MPCPLLRIVELETIHLPENIKLLKVDYEAMSIEVCLFPDEGKLVAGVVFYGLRSILGIKSTLYSKYS